MKALASGVPAAFCQVPDIAPDSVIAPVVPFPLQLLEQDLGPAAVADRLIAVLLQHGFQTLHISAELGAGLGRF